MNLHQVQVRGRKPFHFARAVRGHTAPPVQHWMYWQCREHIGAFKFIERELKQELMRALLGPVAFLNPVICSGSALLELMRR